MTTSDLTARAAWSVLTEPGDAAAEALTTTLGHTRALEALTNGTIGSALAAADVDPATARESLKRWQARLHAGALDANLAAIDRAGVTLLDPTEVPGLTDLGIHAPHVLYVRGNAQALTNPGPKLTTTGARAATPYGEDIAARFVTALQPHGITVLAGGAYGVDAAAHRAALAAGLPTVAFVAGGVDRVYPAGHAHLFSRIAEDGAVVSEVAPGGTPTKWRFLQRNRLLAAAADAVVIVEAGSQSGSLNTAGHAKALGRPLGAVPGPVTSASSEGCHRLLREFGATPITCPSHIADLLGVGVPA